MQPGERRPKGGSPLNDWVRYSSLGIEMAVIIGAAVFAGVKIDTARQRQFPLFTILMTLLGLTIALLRLFKMAK
ncbi:MAG: AtpZ/AtpI family protein [Bacteroidales bacterium]|nr:AtpZ/AtpI family protein [Bacteroidales bacterium]